MRKERTEKIVYYTYNISFIFAFISIVISLLYIFIPGKMKSVGECGYMDCMAVTGLTTLVMFLLLLVITVGCFGDVLSSAIAKEREELRRALRSIEGEGEVHFEEEIEGETARYI